MSSIVTKLSSLSPDRLRGMRRGVEKESLRVNPSLALLTLFLSKSKWTVAWVVAAAGLFGLFFL